MILSAFANDSATFDGLWQYAQYYFNNYGCMAYLVDSNSNALDSNCAPDADEDMAYALLVASQTFSNPAYYNNGIQMANAVYNHSVDAASKVLLPFPPFTPSNTDILNPSYFAPGYYDMFLGRDTRANRWDLVQTNSYNILNLNGPTVVRDWSNVTGGNVDPTLSMSTVCTYPYSSSAVCSQWPWRIRADPFNSIGTKMSFFFENIAGLSFYPTSVSVNCYDGQGIRSGTFSTFDDTNGVIQMWTLSGNTSSCNNYVDIYVSDGTNQAVFKYFYWIGSYCNGVQDGFNGYYSFDAVRMPWRTVFDAAYLGNFQSIQRCNNLVNGPFSSALTINGQKFVPGGQPVPGSFTGALFRSPGAVCATLVGTPAATRTSLLNDLAGPLKDGTYYSDTLQLLMQLFVSGSMTNATCALIDSYITPVNVPDFTAGAGTTAVAPPAVCSRSVSNLNYISLTAGVEFSAPVVQHTVQISCSVAGYVDALQPNPNPYNLFYTNTTCTTSILVKLTPKKGFNGSPVTISSLVPCAVTTTFPSFCWKPSSQRYYLQAQVFPQPAALQYSCADYTTSLSSRALQTFSVSANYPFLYASSGSVHCSESGQTLLTYTDSVTGGTYGYLTNWRPDLGLANELCPTGTTPPAVVPTGSKALFCWRPSSNANYIELRVDTSRASDVQYDCGAGLNPAIYTPASQTYVINPSGGCPTDGEITLVLQGTTYNENWRFNNSCPYACYQNSSSQSYIGVLLEDPQLNATISQPSSVCRYPGPVDMRSTSSYSFDTAGNLDLKGLDYCFISSPANTTITYYDSTYSFTRTLVGDYRDPALQCIS